MPNSTPVTLPLHLAAVATIEAPPLQFQTRPPRIAAHDGPLGPIPELTVAARSFLLSCRKPK